MPNMEKIKKKKKKRKKRNTKCILFPSKRKIDFYKAQTWPFYTSNDFYLQESCKNKFDFYVSRAALFSKIADFEVVDAPANFKSKVWQYFGFARVTDQNGIKTLDKTKTVCKVCEAQIA